jgi:hypothetical protein
MHMKNSLQQVQVLFHNRAGEVMQTLYSQFRYAITPIDRQWEENVFQQQYGKFTSLLKQRLDGIMLELMAQLDTDAERNEWNQAGSRFVQDYLREFSQKIKGL